MKMHPQIKVYGSLTYRDTKTAKEDQEGNDACEPG